MKLALATLLIRLLSLFPLRLLHGLAAPLGWLAWYLPWRKHAVIETNLRLCFPDMDTRSRRRLHRRHLAEMIRLVLESGAVWYWSQQRLLRHVPIVEGWEQVEKAKSEGRGVMFVSGHFGNWEILTLFISVHTPLTALYRAPSDQGINEIISTTRSRFGARMVPSGSPTMRQLLGTLKDGGSIGIMCDQQPKQGDGVFVPFFRTPALTMTLVNRLARRTGCAVIFISATRLTRGKGWALRFSRADEAIAADDPVRANTVMHQWLEAEIRRTPEQYLWSYKRFSLRPPGEPPIYPKKNRSGTT